MGADLTRERIAWRGFVGHVTGGLIFTTTVFVSWGFLVLLLASEYTLLTSESAVWYRLGIILITLHCSAFAWRVFQFWQIIEDYREVTQGKRTRRSLFVIEDVLDFMDAFLTWRFRWIVLPLDVGLGLATGLIPLSLLLALRLLNLRQLAQLSRLRERLDAKEAELSDAVSLVYVAEPQYGEPSEKSAPRWKQQLGALASVLIGPAPLAGKLSPQN